MNGNVNYPDQLLWSSQTENRHMNHKQLMLALKTPHITKFFVSTIIAVLYVLFHNFNYLVGFLFFYLGYEPKEDILLCDVVLFHISFLSTFLVGI